MARGVGRFEGFTLFVDGALPQETVRARVYERKKTFARAHVVETLTHSPHRVDASLSAFRACVEDVKLMHLNYPQQLGG